MHETMPIIKEIVGLIKEGKVTFLVGPGTSNQPPSNLPELQRMTSELLNAFHRKIPVLKRLFPRENDFEKSLQNLCFEELLQLLEDYTGELELLDVFKGGIPNHIHYFLAKCLPLGNKIISTCIDHLIEKSVGKDNLKVCSTNDDFKEIGENASLFKMRGSIENPDSLTITANQIGRAGIAFTDQEEKAGVFDKLVYKKHLVVLGYPPSEDFDIIPRLLYLRRKEKMYWLQHHPVKSFHVASPEEIGKNETWSKFSETGSLVVLRGDTLEFSKKLSLELFGELPDHSSNTDAGLMEKGPRLDEFMVQLVEKWQAQAEGSLELVAGLLLYGGNLREEAMDCFKESEIIFTRQHNRKGVASALTNLSVAYTDQLDFSSAIECLQKSGNIYKELDDIPGLAVTSRDMASLHLARGQWKKALSLFEDSRQLYKSYEDKPGIASVTSSMAQIHTDLGEYEKAANLFFESNTAYKECGDIKGYAMSLGNCGRLLYAQDQMEEAELAFKIALHHLSQIDDQEGISKISNNLGVLYGKLGRVEEAEKFFKAAEDAGKKIGDKTVEMDVLLNKGSMYLKLGKLDEALNVLSQGFGKSIEFENPERYGQALGNIGLALLDSGRASESLHYFKEAKKVYTDLGADIEVAFSNESIGDAYHAVGDRKMAFENYDTSINLLERMRGKFIEESFKLRFQGRIETSYVRMIMLCHELGGRGDAYAYTERSRSRAFVDLLAAAAISPPLSIPVKLKQKENELLTELRRIYNRQISTRDIDKDKFSRELDDIYDKIEKIEPGYAYLRRGKPMTFKEVQACLR